MSTSDLTDTHAGWLPADELGRTRERFPMVYIDAVPVHLDALGQVTEVGLLLRMMPDDTISRAVVSGRVLYGERVREALRRHLLKDLGLECDPLLPTSPAPFTIAEYFPEPERTGYHDPRQHAVSLAYVVPIQGLCHPAQDALDFTWLTVEEAVSPEVTGEMTGGHGRLVRLALAHTDSLP